MLTNLNYKFTFIGSTTGGISSSKKSPNNFKILLCNVMNCPSLALPSRKSILAFKCGCVDFVITLRIGDSGPDGPSIKLTRGHLEFFICFRVSVISSDVMEFIRFTSSIFWVKLTIIALFPSVLKILLSLEVRHFLLRVANKV